MVLVGLDIGSNFVWIMGRPVGVINTSSLCVPVSGGFLFYNIKTQKIGMSLYKKRIIGL
jgi:hypothetical protein